MSLHQDPRAVAWSSWSGRLGSGKSSSPPATSGRPRCSPRTSAGRWSATTRTTRPPPPDAFDVLHFIAGKRLAAGRLTVIDATNVQPEARRPLIALARRHHVLAVAIVLDVPERVCAERNAARPDRDFGAAGARASTRSCAAACAACAGRASTGSSCWTARTRSAAAQVEREPLWNDRRDARGPVRHHRRRARLLRRAGRAAGPARLPARPATASSAAHPAGPHGGVRRRPGGPRARHARACCGW